MGFLLRLDGRLCMSGDCFRLNRDLLFFMLICNLWPAALDEISLKIMLKGLHAHILQQVPIFLRANTIRLLRLYSK